MSDVAAPPEKMLSPSQVRCFMDCQMRWWFKYALKHADPATRKMALGRAIHAALTQNFAQKVETQEDLPREQTEFRDDEDPAELGACGEALVSKYIDEAAPLIEPAAVEMRVEGTIGGIRVQGWIDLMDVNGRIIDLKTAARKPSGIESDYKFQIATYAQLTPGASEKRAWTL